MSVMAAKKEVSEDTQTGETGENSENNKNKDEDLGINLAWVLSI